MSEYGLGAIPSPPDARDFDLCRLIEAAAPLPVPRKYNVSPVPPVLDQDGTGRCGGFTLTRAVMWLQHTDPTVKRWLPLDPDAFYLGAGATRPRRAPRPQTPLRRRDLARGPERERDSGGTTIPVPGRIERDSDAGPGPPAGSAA